MSQELSDEEVKALAMEAFQCTWDADDETLVNKYGHGVYLWRFADFAKAVIAADRAKRVPMTNAQIDQAAAQAASWGDAYADFEDGVRAAEAFHGIGSKT